MARAARLKRGASQGGTRLSSSSTDLQAHAAGFGEVLPALRILYVDDDADLGDLLADLLRAAGYEVDLARSAAAGLARLEQTHYHLVITDYSMPPGETGAWMLREADQRGLLLETARCLITANALLDAQLDCEVLRKPVDVDSFLERVHGLLAPARAVELARVHERLAQGMRVGVRAEQVMEAPRIEFVLYVSAASPSSLKAVRNMTKLLASYPEHEIAFVIRDLSKEPLRDDDEDRVAFTPTLVKRAPLPRTWVIGDLDQIGFVADLISIAGVERKR